MRGSNRANEVSVGGARLTADKIFINVGGRAVIPAIPGLDQVPYLTNSSIMHLDSLPKHLIIVGGSYIGLEFGQMFRRFGSEVTIVESGPRLIAREDEDVSAAILDILQREGIQVRLGTKCKSFARSGRGDRRQRRDSRRELRNPRLACAAGRRAASEYGRFGTG